MLIAVTGVLAWALPGIAGTSPGTRLIIAVAAAIVVGTASWWLWRPRQRHQWVPRHLTPDEAAEADHDWADADRGYLVPRELPPGPAVFVGRADELKELVYGLDTHVSDRPFVAVIRGRAGIGKTALALHFAHQIADRFPDGQTFVHVAEWDSELAADHGAGTAAGTSPAVKIARELFLAMRTPGEKIPLRTEQLFDEYKRVTTGRRLLVVLDDVPADATLPSLAQIGAHGAVIVTTRQDPSAIGADVPLAGTDVPLSAPLEKLHEEEALDLLRRAVGDRYAEQQGRPFKSLVLSCQGEPLALTLAGKAIASRANWQLRDLVALGEQPQSAAGRHADDPLDAAYQLLTRQERRALRCIGVIGQARFAAWALQATLGDDDGGLTRALASGLVRAGLIARTSSGAGGVTLYEVTEPIVAFARGLTDPELDLTDARGRLNERRAERMRANPSVRIRKEVYPRMRAGEFSAAIRRARDALAQAQDNPERRAEEAVCFAALAELYAELGDISAAEDAADSAIRIGRETRSPDSEARALRSLAKLRRRAYPFAGAEKLLDEALSLASRADDPGEQIRVLADRAVVRARRGDFERAEADAVAAVSLSRPAELRQLSVAMLAHGRVFLLQAQSAAADDELRRVSLDRAQQIFDGAYREADNPQGDGSRQLLTMSWIRYAQATAAVGQADLERAIGWVNEAMATFTDTRHRYGIAYCRRLLGTIRLLQNQPGLAATELRGALETFRNCGDTRIAAEASLELAQALLGVGKGAEARRLQQQAVSTYLQLRDQAMARDAAVAFLSSLAAAFRRRPAIPPLAGAAG